MTKKRNIAIITTLFVFMLSLWCIDVSVTTLNLGIMTNGFFNLTLDKTYHLGLYSSMLCFISLCFVSVRD